jgi:aspartate kinase
VLNAQRPEQPGTVIESSAELERLGDSPIRSISWKKGITVVNIRAPRMLGAYGFLRQLFEVFERHEVVVDVLASSEVSVSLTI